MICTALVKKIFDIPADELESLARAIAGFTVMPVMDDAVERFEQEHFTRLRMMVEREAGDIDELRERDPGEVLPAILLVTTLDDDVYARVGAILASRHASGVGALLLGDWPTGTTCEVTKADHRISSTAGPMGDDLLNAKLCHLTADEAAACLRELAGGQLLDAKNSVHESPPDPSGREI